MGNDGLSSKQVGSQASCRGTRRLAWIQPVCICINAVPALKGLIIMLALALDSECRIRPEKKCFKETTLYEAMYERWVYVLC